MRGVARVRVGGLQEGRVSSLILPSLSSSCFVTACLIRSALRCASRARARNSWPSPSPWWRAMWRSSIALSSMARIAFQSESPTDSVISASRLSGEYAAHVSQRAACNALHNVEKRLAVWLLLLTERLDTDTIEVTQERISQHLGVRRAGVTVIAGELHDKGVIANSRGSLRVIDRPALKAAACECYWALEGAAQQPSLQ